jgi:protein-S-isoprenylcysteine O-methyltransferase Ste14
MPLSSASRGTGWVYAQMPLLAAALALPVLQHMVHLASGWPAPLIWPARVVGAVSVAGAVALFSVASRALGPDLVATPAPRVGGVLQTEAIYGRMRHPIYSAIMLGTWGWSLLWNSFVGLALALTCCVFFSVKAAAEERYLRSRYRGYDRYAEAVPRFLPRTRGRSPVA